MHNRSRFANVLWDASLRPGHTALVVLLSLLFLIFLLMFLAFTAQSAQGQTFKVIHNFRVADGSYPMGSLTMDGAGNIYGTTTLGPGFFSSGSVFKLTRSNGNWALTSLHSFHTTYDGYGPIAGVTVSPNGILYGTTPSGSCSGTAFSLRIATNVAASVQQAWDEKTLHCFAGGDGDQPNLGNLLLDRSGNIYGATSQGGAYGGGIVYQLTPSGGIWTENILHSFGSENDGDEPEAGLISDGAGNLYGTTGGGPNEGAGTIYELSPSASGWTEQIIYAFQGGDDGGLPVGGLIFDQRGNLYGTTSASGSDGEGTVFELTPSNAGWTFTVLYSFTGDGTKRGPYGGVVMDASGNLYGNVPQQGAYGSGVVFKLTPSEGGWIYSDIHDFNVNDGQWPYGSLLIDGSGNLYGTTYQGGAYGSGVVFEITP